MIVLLAATAAAFSCVRKVESGYGSLPLVENLVADSLPGLQKLAREASSPSGTIVIVGEPLSCLALSEEMMNCDYFDNVDARKVKDGLPDFSGETIVPVLDFVNSPYDSVLAVSGGAMKLRETAVRAALVALDSTIRCKVLVICSPQLAGNGGEDVADLFSKISCEVPVICPADSTVSLPETCFTAMRERNLFTHNIAYPVARLSMTVPGTEDSPFSAVPFDDSMVPESFADTVGVFAPNTFISHVQNKRQP